MLTRVRGLPLDEVTVSDGRFTETLKVADGRLLLPLPSVKRGSEVYTIEDAGVELSFTRLYPLGMPHLVYRCADLSHFNQRLAPRLLSKAAHSTPLIFYEIKDDTALFYSYSRVQNKGFLLTEAYILASFCNISKAISGEYEFSFITEKGRKYLAVDI